MTTFVWDNLNGWVWGDKDLVCPALRTGLQGKWAVCLNEDGSGNDRQCDAECGNWIHADSEGGRLEDPPWWHMRKTMETWVMNLGEETRVGGHMFKDLCPTLRAIVNDNSPPHIIVDEDNEKRIGPGNLPVLHNCQLWDEPENDKSPCLRARGGTGGNQNPMVPEEDKMGHYVVRRITPKECERLQAFPDNFTAIGEWIDKKGKKRATTDAARYKALGNSMCVNVMRAIGVRIDWALANPITGDTSEKLDWQPDLFGF